MDTSSPGGKRPSCDNCRQAHKGCDRKGPPCGRCIAFGIEKTCVFVPRKRKINANSSQSRNNSISTTATTSPRNRGRPQKTPRKASFWKTKVKYEDKLLSDDFYVSNFGYFPVRDPYSLPLTIVNPHDEGESAKIEQEAENCFPVGILDQSIKEVLKTLPKPSFREVNEQDEVHSTNRFRYESNWVRPASYIVYQERQPEEQDELCEYDLDSEDERWLHDYNLTREKEDLPPISEDDFEIIMDRLEKESFYHESISSPPCEEDIDTENTNCCICQDGTSDDTNQIVFCDGCDIAVHQECYGIRCIPEGLWFCQKCDSEQERVECVMCPSLHGAFKKTTDGRWAHVICALWIPETSFRLNPGGFRGEIQDIDKIPKERWKLVCDICKKRGACIQCKERTCLTAFHVTCAQEAGLYMQSKEKNGRLVYFAACEKHAPKKKWKHEKERLEKKENLPKTPTPKKKFLEVFSHQTISLQVAEKVIHPAPPKSIPSLWKYWIEKRKSRSGNPLLKRLSKNILFSPRYIMRRGNADEEEQRETLEKLRLLRQDLERCRILLEVVKKREVCKRQLIELKNEIFQFQADPKFRLLHYLLKQFERHDKYSFFREDPSKDLYPDYYVQVQQPMSFNTMRKRLNETDYSIEGFWSDFELLCNNAKEYHHPSSRAFRAATKLYEFGQKQRERLTLESIPTFLEVLDRLDKREEEEDISEEISDSGSDDNDEIVAKYLPLPQSLSNLSQATNMNGKVHSKIEDNKTFQESTTPNFILPVQEGQKKQDELEEEIEEIEDNGIEDEPEEFEEEIQEITETKYLGHVEFPRRILERILDHFFRFDYLEIFHEPVSTKDVPDYLDVISNPMDLSTMAKKLKHNKYETIQEFQEDFNLMVNNATTYNLPKTIFYAEAKILRWIGNRCIERVKRDPSSAIASPHFCSLCNSSKHADKVVVCGLCTKGFHIFCLNPPLRRIPKSHHWYCQTCEPSKICNFCRKEEDDPRILLCDMCNRGYHIYCLNPPLQKIPEGKWYCSECDPSAYCNTCGKINHTITSEPIVICQTCKRAFHSRCLKPPLDQPPQGKWFCSICEGEEPYEREKQLQRIDKEPPTTPLKKMPTVSNHTPPRPTNKKRFGACAEHRKRKKRCPDDCPGRIAKQKKALQSMASENKRKKETETPKEKKRMKVETPLETWSEKRDNTLKEKKSVRIEMSLEDLPEKRDETPRIAFTSRRRKSS